jgi:hypothetical protein
MIDKVFSMVVTIVVVLALGVVLFVTVFSGFSSTQTLARQTYEQEYGSLLIDSLFLSHENQSDLPYEALLALSLQEVETVVTVQGQDIDVEQEFSQALDELLGQGNYYFTVEPQVKGVSVSYILDGSQTMADKRQAVNAELPDLVQDLRGLFGEEAAVYSHVYILQGAGTTGSCNDFTFNRADITCDNIRGEDVYAFLEYKGYAPPVPAPYRTYREWIYSEHAATVSHMFESDWASASAYASYKYQDSGEEKLLTSKHVVVVVADEMASNSKADACHGLRKPMDTYVCFLCDATCPTNRSFRLVNQTKEILVDNNDLFFGFHSLRCDYNYDSSVNDQMLTRYTCRFTDAGCGGILDLEDPENSGRENPTAEEWGVESFCLENACGGCVPPSPPTGKYCYHSNCNQYIISNLTLLAEATGGRAVDLSDLQQLTDEVFQYFEGQTHAFDFTIGVLDETRDRYVVERRLTLSNGKRITLRFWIYDAPQDT